jgi:hypothetical protein
MRALDFLIIGAQKAGTTWLWDKLNRHPGTDLPKEKEIQYFGGVENYHRGKDWYFRHFDGLDPDKITGEASTTYFYDYMPYWYNDSNEIMFDNSLPPIAELITRDFPDIKVIVSLRDPVERAISAYRHWMKKGQISPLAGLKKTILNHPKLRILEYGFYSKYLEMWRRYVPDDRLLTIIFEEDIVGDPNQALKKLFSFLNLETDIRLEAINKVVHQSWDWNRIVLEYYAAPLTRIVGGRISSRISKALKVFNLFPFNRADLEFLREQYAHERERIQQLTGRSLSIWSYGSKKLSNLRE